MKKPRCTDRQIAQALRQVEQGTAVAWLWRKLGVSETTFCHWKKRYAGMRVRRHAGRIYRGLLKGVRSAPGDTNTVPGPGAYAY